MSAIKPTLVLKNGSVYTVDHDRSWAQAIALAHDKIVFVGSNADVEPYIESDTVVIDLSGKMVLPGFVDAHGHPSLAMDFVGNISLYGLASLDAYQKAIAEFVQSHTEAELFRGSGWDNGLFSNLGPTKEILDAIVPDRPISLSSYDGHSLWVNSATLERAGITKDTPNPEGGVIEHNPDSGEPNGTLRETAQKLIESALPGYSMAERKNALLAYQDMASRSGITMAYDAMLDAQCIAAFKTLETEGLLKMRFYGAVHLEPDRGFEQIETMLAERSKNRHPYFQTNSAKIFVDGVIEGSTGYLLEPYQHMPEFSGEPLWGAEILNAMAEALDKENVQIHIHAIGDAATRISLDAFEYTRQKNGQRDSRHAITHLHLVAPEDIPRFKQLGVIGVPQPFWFKIDDYYWNLALPYLGQERADRQYPMQSFIEAGVMMASSSDFPVTIPFDPLLGIQLGVTRSEVDKVSEDILWPEERVSLEDMIATFTYNGAYANFLENETGSIEVGKQADIVVLEQNIFELPMTEIAKTKVLLTLVDGKEVFRDSAFARRLL